MSMEYRKIFIRYIHGWMGWSSRSLGPSRKWNQGRNGNFSRVLSCLICKKLACFLYRNWHLLEGFHLFMLQNHAACVTLKMAASRKHRKPTTPRNIIPRHGPLRATLTAARPNPRYTPGKLRMFFLWKKIWMTRRKRDIFFITLS